eukprot:GHVR01010452.1.p1 GENE.GHVR01010452.1~~GHVR01010452.1.p1  ORF type:complete len:247 (-),score=53.95 GHVR01010452.1:639-1379(-)
MTRQVYIKSIIYVCLLFLLESCIGIESNAVDIQEGNDVILPKGQIGCAEYSSLPSRRMLRSQSTSNISVTHETCGQQCLSLNKEFSAIRSSSDCTCLNARELTNAIESNNENDCEHYCSGNNKQICGGRTTARVFRSDLRDCDEAAEARNLDAIPDYYDPADMQGCYAYAQKNNGMLEVLKSKDMSNQVCVCVCVCVLCLSNSLHQFTRDEILTQIEYCYTHTKSHSSSNKHLLARVIRNNPSSPW